MWFLLLAGMAFADKPALRALDGVWVPIGEHEAANRAVAVYGCYSRRATWTLVSDGATVTATFTQGHHASGMLRVTSVSATGELTGTWDQDQLTLEGEQVWATFEYGERKPQSVEHHPQRYQLTLDRKSGHLVGTLNDKPTRLAPGIETPINAAACGPPPP